MVSNNNPIHTNSAVSKCFIKRICDDLLMHLNILIHVHIHSSFAECSVSANNEHKNGFVCWLGNILHVDKWLLQNQNEFGNVVCSKHLASLALEWSRLFFAARCAFLSLLLSLASGVCMYVGEFFSVAIGFINLLLTASC